MDQYQEMRRWGHDPYAKPAELSATATPAVRAACKEVARTIVLNAVASAAHETLANAFVGVRVSVLAELKKLNKNFNNIDKIPGLAV